MAYMAQSVEIDHGIMKEEDTEPRTLTQSSPDSHTLICLKRGYDYELGCQQTWVYKLTLLLASCGTLSKSPPISELQVLHVPNGERKNLPLLSCGEGYVKRKKSKVLSLVSRTQ